MTDTPVTTDPADARAAAVKRLTARRDFAAHLLCYVVFNAALIVVWLVTGHGYFWPAWVLGAWGVGLAMHAWDVYGRRPITEEDIRREMNRQGARRA